MAAPIGMVHFNGDMNTGLTLRTIRIKDGIAEVRAGATLLFDSDPEEEEAETELKASAMLSAIRDAKRRQCRRDRARRPPRSATGVNILLVDHEDSFVHTLANYFRQTGAKVTTVRTPVPEEMFDRLKPDLVVLSPGPGTPTDFDCEATITQGARRATCRSSASASACRRWPRPMAASCGSCTCRCTASRRASACSKPGIIFSGLPKEVTVGRYHSIFADPVRLPDDSWSRPRPRTASSWPSSTARSRSPPCSSTRNRS